MTRIEQRFAALKARGEKALMPYICAGDPDLETTRRLLPALQAAGADAIEYGIPFSDPIADGPVIQQAGQRALAAGITVEKAFALLKEARENGFTIPVCIMTYYNLIYSRGVEQFALAAAAAGADGIIVPDLSLEESEPLQAACRDANLNLIQFIAPTSPPERMQAIAQQSSGFIYCVSLTGVTGARDTLSERIAPMVAAARQHTGLPLCVGFGVSTPAHARQVAAQADGVIVGSAVVRLCGEGGSPAEIAQRVGDFVRSLKEGVRGA